MTDNNKRVYVKARENNKERDGIIKIDSVTERKSIDSEERRTIIMAEREKRIIIQVMTK